MISPETLRRFPFFGFLDEEQLMQIAMISQAVQAPEGEILFREGSSADHLYLLVEGSIELYFSVANATEGGVPKDLHISFINPGEICSISALIEPYTLSTSARASRDSMLLQIDAPNLRQFCEKDPVLACGMHREAARAAMKRLEDTRVQIAGAS